MSALAVRQEASAADAAGRTALAAVASLAPFFFILQLRSKLNFDNLHIGLFQVIFLFVLRYVVNLVPGKKIAQAKAAITDGGDPQQGTDLGVKSAGDEVKAKVGSKGKKQKGKKVKSKEHPVYSGAKIDGVLHRFLSIVDPKALEKLPKPAGEEASPDPKPLNDWKHTLDQDDLKVFQHPSIDRLFAISYHLRDIPIRKIWDLLISAESRPQWDNLCQKAERVEEIEDGWGRRASIAYMAMKGMFPVKPKDVLMLSVVTRLPDGPPTVGGSGETGVRVCCATSSVDHPKKPEQPGLNRMTIKISGFILEDDGAGGCRLTQITDLSGLGGWIPDSIIQTVTKNMIPKSLERIGKVAKDFVPPADHPGTEDRWLPPELGSWLTAKEGEGEGEEVEEVEEGDADDDEEAEDDEELAPSTSRNLHALVSQLRAVTGRLQALESSGSPSTGSSPGSKSTLLGKLTGSSSSVAVTGDSSPSFLGLLGSSILGATGGIVGAATVFALAMRLNDRNRRLN